MVPEWGAKAALEWIAEKLRRSLVDPALVEPLERQIQALQNEIDAHAKTRKSIDRLVRTLDTPDAVFWTSREATWPFDDYNDRVDQRPVRQKQKRRPLIITMINYKGGVGKTTTTANLAAYFSSHLNKRVLLLDVDYQGSLTTVLRKETALSGVSDNMGRLLSEAGAPGVDSEGVLRKATVQLRQRMTNSQLVPASYSLARTEDKIMIEWLLERAKDDVRFRLASVLLADCVGDHYDVVLIDAAPRLTTGTINALAASTHVLTPTIFNEISVRPAAEFLRQTKGIMNKLNPSLKFLGVLETMSPPGNERQSNRDDAEKSLKEDLMSVGVGILDVRIPRKPALTDGSVAYYSDPDIRSLFQTVGDKIVTKVMSTGGGIP